MGYYNLNRRDKFTVSDIGTKFNLAWAKSPFFAVP